VLTLRFDELPSLVASDSADPVELGVRMVDVEEDREANAELLGDESAGALSWVRSTTVDAAPLSGGGAAREGVCPMLVWPRPESIPLTAHP